MQLNDEDTFARHRTGEQMTTKLSSITLRAKENPKCRFISLAHLLTEEFLKECLTELKRDRVSGIDGVNVEQLNKFGGINL